MDGICHLRLCALEYFIFEQNRQIFVRLVLGIHKIFRQFDPVQNRLGLREGLYGRRQLDYSACYPQYRGKFHFVFPDGNVFALPVSENAEFPQNGFGFILHDFLCGIDSTSPALRYF